MKTLLLTSQGFKVKDEILKILPKPPAEIRVAHIITASRLSNHPKWRDDEKELMIKLGFTVEDIDVFGKNESDLFSLLQDKDIVYVQGGDPYYLLKYVKQSGFDNVVKELIQQGKIYIGCSAGTYIACPTIEMALWKKPLRNTHGLAGNESGMNLVPFLVSVHYESKYHDAVKQGIEHTKYPVKVLHDNQALLIKDDSVELVGDTNEIILQ